MSGLSGQNCRLYFLPGILVGCFSVILRIFSKKKKIDFRSKKVSENWAKVFVTVVYVVKYMLVFAPEDPGSKSNWGPRFFPSLLGYPRCTYTS